MPVVRPSDAVVHEMHGARFVSYAAPSTGSRELCAWRGEIPAGTRAPAHTVSREEIFHLLAGELLITLDGTPTASPQATRWSSTPVPRSPWRTRAT
ncbi:hypothetical protein SHKM778_66190 [Streptomyces sp. KM77-8]|uniref:Cupin domain-containing protein n=1 Tax=Streptomyces haneummycinicus TaxID=3074435 RepID=A0AAT9HSB7_9ACTN